MNNKNNSNESVKYVSNINELGVKVTVESINEQPTQQPQPTTQHTNTPYTLRTAQQRKDALAAAGIDVSKYFAMGNEMLVRMNANGEPEQVLDNDPIFNKIYSQGYINVHKLFRRWVMAQMFELMHSEYSWMQGNNLTQRIKNKGYEYTWEMTVKELYAQMKMNAHGDNANFKLRHLWFNRSIVVKMARDYMDKLAQYIEELPEKNCNKYKYHQKYKTINGVHVFVEDMDAKVWRNINGAFKELTEAWSIDKLYYATKKFNEARVNLGYGTPQCEAWIQAFKGSGAYWTAQNLIMFHGCHVYPEGSKKYLNQNCSMVELNEQNLKYAHAGEGWRMIGFLKKLMDDNHIDIEKKRAEWRANKARK